jgi:hypothetical protein
MGAVEGVRNTGGEDVALDGDDDADFVDGSSGKDEDACCCWVSPLAVLVSTRGADFGEALAGGMTLGGFDELKKRPPGGFENRE